MASPIHVNPSNAFRRLTIGGSDWLWVVFTLMILSAVAVFVWSKSVGLFPCVFGFACFKPGPSIESNLGESEHFIISP